MSEPARQSDNTSEPPAAQNPTPPNLLQPVDPMAAVLAGERFDDQGRRLCHAHSKRSGELCRSPAIAGLAVCRMHGGGAPQNKNRAKLRLLELVDPAIKTLAKEMRKADKSADRQAAANSILDRAGWGRVAKIETHDARELLIARLRELRDEIVDAEVVDEPSAADRLVDSVRQAIEAAPDERTQEERDEAEWEEAAPGNDENGDDGVENAHLPLSPSDPPDPNRDRQGRLDG